MDVDFHSTQGVTTRKFAPPGWGDAAHRTGQIVDEAEERTRSACILCGRGAQTACYDGYFITLCVEHQPPAHTSASERGAFMQELTRLMRRQ